MTYRLSDGVRTKQIDLGSPINAGGATGKVFRVAQNTALCAKIYHDLEYAKKIKPKIMAMIAASPNLKPISFQGAKHHQVAWPEKIIENDAGEFVGFTMPLLTANKTVALSRLLTKSGRQQEKISESYETRLLVARNLAAIVKEVHDTGHAIVDLKPINFRLYRNAPFICLIDADGLRIKGPGQEIYPAEHVSDEYTSPESKGKASSDLGVSQDLFAMAALIFQLMNNGVHPFQGIPEDNTVPTSTQERILAGLYAYGTNPTRLKPSPQSAHHFFDNDTRALFERAFASVNRPTAAEWLAHLTEITRPPRIRKCSVSTDHLAFTRGCPACHLDEVVAARKQGGAKNHPANAPSAPQSNPMVAVPFPPANSIQSALPRASQSNQSRFGGWHYYIIFAAVIAYFGLKLPTDSRVTNIPSPEQTTQQATSLLATPAPSAPVPIEEPTQECRDPKSGLSYTVRGPRCIPVDMPESTNQMNRAKKENSFSSFARMYKSKAISYPPKNTLQYSIQGGWSQHVNDDQVKTCVAVAEYNVGILVAYVFYEPNEALLVMGLDDEAGAPFSRDNLSSRIVTLDIDGDEVYSGRIRPSGNHGAAFGKIDAKLIEAIKGGLSMFIVVDGVEPAIRLQLKGSSKALSQAQKCAQDLGL